MFTDILFRGLTLVFALCVLYPVYWAHNIYAIRVIIPVDGEDKK